MPVTPVTPLMNTHTLSKEGWIVVGTSRNGDRYWIFASDVEARKAINKLESATYGIREVYTLRRANVMQMD